MDFIPLVETQINQSLIPNKDSLHVAIFLNHPAASMLSNNANELVGRRQQGEVITAAKGEIAKHATSTGADPTRLGRRNRSDMVNSEKSCESFLHVNVQNQNHHLAQCIVNDEDSFLIEASAYVLES